ncbi:MAG: dUTP diphosphatase [Pseudohongiellaceae bacterium]
MLTDVQARTMLSLQSLMNSKVDPEWLQARYPYLRAVVVEGSEAIEHHGWKWWKKQDRDLPQLQMELIDIWHFMLSEILLQNNGRLEDAIHQLQAFLTVDHRHKTLHFDGTDYALGELDLITRLELLIGTAVVRRVEMGLFETIMRDCHMDWDELFRQYVGKNVLNLFRQDHGYKKGHYRKLWQGKEDNQHLVEIMQELDANDEAYQERLYQSLARRYEAVDS